MAQRKIFRLSAVMGLWASLFSAGSRPQPKESRAIPLRAGDLKGDFGEAGKSLPPPGKPLFHPHDPVGSAIPGSHQLRARLDPSRQFEPTVRFGLSRLHQLIEQTLMLPREAAIGPLLNPVRDAAPKQIRTERFGWPGAEQLLITATQLDDRQLGQPLQLGLDRWIGRPVACARAYARHDAVPTSRSGRCVACRLFRNQTSA